MRQAPQKMKKSSPEKKDKQLTVILNKLDAAVLAELMENTCVNTLKHNFQVQADNMNSYKRQQETIGESNDRLKSRVVHEISGRSKEETPPLSNRTRAASKRPRNLAMKAIENDTTPRNDDVPNEVCLKFQFLFVYVIIWHCVFQVVTSIGATSDSSRWRRVPQQDITKKLPPRVAKRISAGQTNFDRTKKKLSRTISRKQLDTKIEQKSPCNEFLEGEIILGTIPGFAPWPATMVKIVHETIYIQFFGTGHM